MRKHCGDAHCRCLVSVHWVDFHRSQIPLNLLYTKSGHLFIEVTTMTVRFGNHRLGFYSEIIILLGLIFAHHVINQFIPSHFQVPQGLITWSSSFLIDTSGVILGLAANFANLFLPDLHRTFLSLFVGW